MALSLAAGLTAQPASAAQPGLAVAPAHQTVNLAAGTVQVEIQMQSVGDVAAFGFDLHYDSGVLSSPAVVAGPFLGSTGRQVECLDPIFDNPTHGGVGTIQYGCATVGSGAAASGTGLAATVTFHLAGGSTTELKLQRVSIGNVLGDSICGGACGSVGGSIDVTGGDSGKNQGVTSTPDPSLPPDDAPATSGPVSQDPASQAPAAGATATSQPAPALAVGPAAAAPGRITGADDAFVAGSGSAVGTASGGTAGSPAGTAAGARVGKLGMGPPPANDGAGRNARFGAVVLGAGGIGLLAAGAHTRRRTRGR